MALNDKQAPVLFVVTDAFRHDYLKPENTPALCSLAEKGCFVSRLRPNYGFCERTEMFTGTRPDQNGFFTALTFDEQNSAFRSLRTEIGLLSLFDWNTTFLRRYFRRFFRDWFKKIRGVSQPVYEIPLRLLPRIALTEDVRELHLPGWSDFETIFDILREQGKTFYFDTFVSLTMNLGLDDDRTAQICRILREDPFDLYLVYIGDGDGTGHDFGPHSPEALEMNRRVDARVKKITDAFFKNHPGGRFLVIGDHGMLEVKRHIDLQEKILSTAKKARLRMGKDYDYFLDSTLARLWLHSPAAKEVFPALFREDGEITIEGKIMDAEEARRLHVPLPEGRYGDLIWMANPGVLVFPDFFHYRKACRGMHGYDTHVSGQKGFAIVVGRDIPSMQVAEAELIDVCPVLCQLCGIRTPKHNTGKCFLE